MRILYIAQYTSAAFRNAHCDRVTPGLGGLRKIELVCEALSRVGHHVVLLSSAMLGVSRWRVRSREEERIDCGGHAVRVVYPAALELKPFGGLVNALRARRIADRIIGEIQPDAVLLYNAYLFEYLATTGRMSASNLPVFVEVEDLPLARKREWGNVKPILDQRCWDPLVARASGFTAANGAIQRLFPPGKPSSLLPGIVDDRLQACSARRREPFAGDRHVLGYFGGLAEDKGVRILLDLLPTLPEPWDVVVGGSGPLARLFEAAQGQYPNRLHFLGTVETEELYRQMCACDCTLIPAERITGDGDGVFPFKLFEYLVAKTHIIAPRLRPLDDSVAHFVQRWDATLDSLVRLLRQGQVDYRAESEMRESAAALVASQYSIDGVGRLFNALLATQTRVPIPDEATGLRASGR